MLLQGGKFMQQGLRPERSAMVVAAAAAVEWWRFLSCLSRPQHPRLYFISVRRGDTSSPRRTIITPALDTRKNTSLGAAAAALWPYVAPSVRAVQFRARGHLCRFLSADEYSWGCRVKMRAGALLLRALWFSTNLFLNSNKRNKRIRFLESIILCSWMLQVY